MELTVTLDPSQRQELCAEIVSAILAQIPFNRPPELDKKLTKTEAAGLLQVSEKTIDDYRRSGLLPYQKLGSRVYFKYSDLLNAGTTTNRLNSK